MMQTENVAELLFEKWRTLGVEEGRRRSLLGVYAARFREVPPAIAATVNAETDDATLSGWIALFVTGSAQEIAAALATR